MARKQHNTGDRPEIKRLEELEAEFQMILARYRGEVYDVAESDAAIVRVDEAIAEAARKILRGFPRTADVLAENAGRLWWVYMLEKNGGFLRYDGVRPFAAYAFGTLKRIAVGRENLADQYHRRAAVRAPKDGRRDPTAGDGGKAKADRRQVPLEFDPVDYSSTDRSVQRRELAEAAWDMLEKTPEDERDLLIRRYINGENLAALARERGITPNALHLQLHRARQAFRERFPDFEF